MCLQQTASYVSATVTVEIKVKELQYSWEIIKKKHILHFTHDYLWRCAFSSLYGNEWHYLQIQIQYGGYSNETCSGDCSGHRSGGHKKIAIGTEAGMPLSHQPWPMYLLHKNSHSSVGTITPLGTWYLYLTSTAVQCLSVRGLLHHHSGTVELVFKTSALPQEKVSWYAPEVWHHAAWHLSPSGLQRSGQTAFQHWKRSFTYLRSLITWLHEFGPLWKGTNGSTLEMATVVQTKSGSSSKGNPLVGVSMGCLHQCPWEPFPMVSAFLPTTNSSYGTEVNLFLDLVYCFILWLLHKYYDGFVNVVCYRRFLRYIIFKKLFLWTFVF
jgi:hypothetical protein